LLRRISTKCKSSSRGKRAKTPLPKRLSEVIWPGPICPHRPHRSHRHRLVHPGQLATDSDPHHSSLAMALMRRHHYSRQSLVKADAEFQSCPNPSESVPNNSLCVCACTWNKRIFRNV
jgi:hypothetical protein